MDEKLLVLLLHQHLIEKAATRIALLIQNLALTQTGIDQQPKRERQIRFLGKILDRLRPPIFPQREIVLGEMLYDLPMRAALSARQRGAPDANRDRRNG